MGNRLASDHESIDDGGTSSDSKKSIASIFEDVIQPCLAEFFGVAFFVFIGTVSVASGDTMTEAVAHGLALAVAIGSLGIISGGHFNPAVTIGVCIARGLAPGLGLFYIVSQLVGAIVGAACCRGVLDYESNVMHNGHSQTVYEEIKGGTHHIGDHVGVARATLAEIITTMLLVTVVLMAAVRRRHTSEAVVAPVYIGLAVLVGIIATGDVSGGSMNPARSFGASLVAIDQGSKVWKNHWVYWVGPIVGSILAGWLYRALFAEPDKRSVLKRY